MERRSFLKQASAGIAAGAAAAPALAADLPTIKWRCASGFPKTLDAIFGATETVARRVAAATGGKFQISLFAAGEIVPTPGVLDAVKDGTVELQGEHRRAFGFDSFEGLPPAKAIDGESALGWQQDTTSDTYYDNCTAAEEECRKALAMTGRTRFETRKGWFQDTLPLFRSESPTIALLRLDGDWYESTMECLENLYDLVVPNGIVIFDDYLAWDGCARAVHVSPESAEV